MEKQHSDRTQISIPASVAVMLNQVAQQNHVSIETALHTMLIAECARLKFLQARNEDRRND